MEFFSKALRRWMLTSRFKRYLGKGKLVVVKPQDHQLGLTTMLIHKCVLEGLVLLVPDQLELTYTRRLFCSLYPELTHESMLFVRCVSSVRNNSARFNTNVRYLTDNSMTSRDLMGISYQVKAKIEGGFVCLNQSSSSTGLPKSLAISSRNTKHKRR